MQKHKNTFIVGLFLTISLIVLGIVIISYGNWDEFFRKKYTLYVSFKNAKGVIKGGEVKLSGSKIGIVETDPYFQDNFAKGVMVKILIFDNFKIPENSKFVIDQASFFGDFYINIIPPDDFEKYIQFDTVIKGKSGNILKELEENASKILEQIKDSSDKINKASNSIEKITNKIDEKLFSEDNVDKVSTILANIEKSTNKFNKFFGDIEDSFTSIKDGVGNIEEASDSVLHLITKFNDHFDVFISTIKNLKPNVDKINDLVENFSEFSNDVKIFTKKINQNNGLLATLLNDNEISNNLKKLVYNLKEKGIIFYKNVYDKHKNSKENSKKRKKRGLFGK